MLDVLKKPRWEQDKILYHLQFPTVKRWWVFFSFKGRTCFISSTDCGIKKEQLAFPLLNTVTNAIASIGIAISSLVSSFVHPSVHPSLPTRSFTSSLIYPLPRSNATLSSLYVESTEISTSQSKSYLNWQFLQLHCYLPAHSRDDRISNFSCDKKKERNFSISVLTCVSCYFRPLSDFQESFIYSFHI